MDLYFLTNLFLSNSEVDNGHCYDHALNVVAHAKNAIDAADYLITDDQKLLIEYACLLHDVDDHKFFPTSSNFDNAKRLLKQSNVPIKFHDDIIFLISLVSCSTNGNNIPDNIEEWMLYPRIADRMESIGYIGIERALEYGKYIGRPIHNNNTVRVNTVEQLMDIATPERFQQYVNKKLIYNDTTIDHFYNKVIHISRYEYYGIHNSYFKKIADERLQIIQDFILDYWLIK